MPYEPCPRPDKAGFPSERRALAVMRQMCRRGRRYGARPRRVYHCGCGLWHVTSKPERPDNSTEPVL